ncbi:MAG: SecDF P1 head subdomain-containing protein, partial [Mucilaginibacter sp.]
NGSITHNSYDKNSDSTLLTGWYYIVDLDNEYKRQLKKSQVYYFIDPTAIVLSKNFKTLKIYDNSKGIPEMLMPLDDKGTEAWSIATEKYIGKKLAFILDDKLLEADYVNSQITAGITALISGDYTKAELENIKTIIESEK